MEKIAENYSESLLLVSGSTFSLRGPFFFNLYPVQTVSFLYLVGLLSILSQLSQASASIISLGLFLFTFFGDRDFLFFFFFFFLSLFSGES